MYSGAPHGGYGTFRCSPGKKVRTTVSRKTVAAGDRVNRQCVAERPDQLWVADFTYGVPGVQGGHGCLNEPRVCLEY